MWSTPFLAYCGETACSETLVLLAADHGVTVFALFGLLARGQRPAIAAGGIDWFLATKGEMGMTSF